MRLSLAIIMKTLQAATSSRSGLLGLTLSLVLAVPLLAQETKPVDIGEATQRITTQDLHQHIRTLSSDAYEGRGPGGVGETLTVAYLTRQFQSLGLVPANPDGSYTQKVPMVGIQSQTSAQLTLNGTTETLTYPQDFVAWTPRPTDHVKVTDSQLVFVGYGVKAPEYHWDDYKSADLAGQTLVMLVNDPQIVQKDNTSELDDNFFKGKEMTYYGRWTYKLEEAARQGAAAVILIHETGPAGYPYFVVVNSWGRENFTLKTPDGNADDVPVAAWFSFNRARTTFAQLGHDFDDLKQQALKPDFTPLTLAAKVSFQLDNSVREISSQNVLAKVPGADPKKRDDHIIVTAHWDHIGRNEKLEGDQIFNGALDNATGVAGLLELADVIKSMDPPLARSVLFLATTGEEQGLLGAQYYAENPFVPMAKTIANINIDGLNQWGRTRDVVLIGRGSSTLDTLVEDAAKAQNRVIKGDPESEKGYFYRSDHFQFAKQGVPALFLNAGIEYLGKESSFGAMKRKEFRENDYHKVSDEIKSDWNLTGAVEDLELLAQVVYRLSQDEAWPHWRPGSEFRQIREKSLKAAR